MGQGRVEGIQARCTPSCAPTALTVSRLVNSTPAFSRGGAARREVILDDQVLGASPCSQRGRCRCSSPVTWMSIPSQPSAAKAFWTLSWGRGGDFVNHAPGERKLLLGPGVGFGGHVAGGFPGVQHREKALPQLLPVLGAVVHGHQGQGGAAGFKPGQAAGCQGAQQRLGLPGGAAHCPPSRRRLRRSPSP